MDAPPSPNHVFNFPEKEDFEENPQEEPEDELEVDVEEDVPRAATPLVGSPITPPPLLESSSDSVVATPVVTSGIHEMPPPGRINVTYLERYERKRQAEMDANSSGVHRVERHMNALYRDLSHDVQFTYGVEDRMTGLENNDQEKKLEKAFYHMQVWVSERLGWGAMDACPDGSIDVVTTFGETMPPRRLRRAVVEQLIADRVAEAIVEHERNRPNLVNVRGVVNVQGCTHKTFMKAKPCLFNKTKGVAGLRRWIEKVEQGRALTWWNGNVHTRGLVNANSIPLNEIKTMMTTEYYQVTKIQRMEQALWTLTMKEDDIEAYNNHFHELTLMCPDLVTPEKKKIKRCIRGFPDRFKVNVTSSKHASLHDAINMARELVDILFDSGAEQSFVSTMFTPFIDIASATLKTNYEVELADGKVVSTNTVLHGCTSALFNHVFKIDLLPTQLGSFNVIVRMDLLSYHHAVIDCYEKIVHVPLLNGEILEIQGERLEKDLRFFSCIKADEKKPEDIRIIRKYLEFLGHVVNRDGIHVDHNKIESVKNWKTPESPIDIRSFLGLVGYYLRFIENFSKIAKPLTLLTQKNKTYVWGDKQEEAFRILKEKLCNDPVLALPNGPNDFMVYCDASNQGFGCVLMQRGKKELNMLQRWWIKLLSDYECEIRYHPGKANFVADALSRKERLKSRQVRAMSITVHSGLKTKILEAQREASKDLKAIAKWLQGLDTQRADKMYYDLQDLKIDIAECVSKLLTCSKIKANIIIPHEYSSNPKFLSGNGRTSLWT
nr:hypothetical protein [Tanacetum cinerariifolium]GEW52205.1 hypothetical protein [Tanacetum cinerariifolium]